MVPKPIAAIPVSHVQGDLGVDLAKATDVKVFDKPVFSKAKVSTIPAPSRVISFSVAPPVPRPKGIVIRDPIQSIRSGLESKFSTASAK